MTEPRPEPETTARPWLDSEAAVLIGPVEEVAELTAEGRQRLEEQLALCQRVAARSRVAWYVGLAGLVGGVLLVLLVSTGWPVALGLALACGTLLLSWSNGLSARSNRANHTAMLQGKLLVGMRGFAVWTPLGEYPFSWSQVALDMFGEPPEEVHLTTLRERFYVRELFDCADRLALRAQAELRTLSEAAGGATVVGHHPYEPWLDTDAARLIGPIEQVVQPREEVVRVRRARLGYVNGGYLLLVVIFLGGVLLTFTEPAETAPKPVYLVTFLLVGSFVLFLLTAGVTGAAWLLDSRLLLGPRGLVIWGAQGVVAVLWEEVGTFWHVTSDVPRNEATGAVRRTYWRFQRADGVWFYLTDLYEDGERVAERIHAALEGRGTPAQATPQVSVPAARPRTALAGAFRPRLQ